GERRASSERLRCVGCEVYRAGNQAAETLQDTRNRPGMRKGDPIFAIWPTAPCRSSQFLELDAQLVAIDLSSPLPTPLNHWRCRFSPVSVGYLGAADGR